MMQTASSFLRPRRTEKRELIGEFVSMLTRLKNSALFLAIPFLLPLLWAQNSACDPAFRNPDLSPDDRAADVVRRLTLPEKVLQMHNSAPAIQRLGIPAYDWWNEAFARGTRARP